MQCTAKKFEAGGEPEISGGRNMDHVLTTQELARKQQIHQQIVGHSYSPNRWILQYFSFYTRSGVILVWAV